MRRREGPAASIGIVSVEESTLNRAASILDDGNEPYFAHENVVVYQTAVVNRFDPVLRQVVGFGFGLHLPKKQ